MKCSLLPLSHGVPTLKTECLPGLLLFSIVYFVFHVLKLEPRTVSSHRMQAILIRRSEAALLILKSGHARSLLLHPGKAQIQLPLFKPRSLVLQAPPETSIWHVVCFRHNRSFPFLDKCKHNMILFLVMDNCGPNHFGQAFVTEGMSADQECSCTWKIFIAVKTLCVHLTVLFPQDFLCF